MSDETVITAPVAEEVKAPKVVEFSIADLLEDLKNGIDRKAQAKKYGVPLAVLNRAYLSTPLLKGKKVHKEREKRPGSRTMGFVFTDLEKFEGSTASATSNDSASTEAKAPEVTQATGTSVETSPAANTNAGW